MKKYYMAFVDFTEIANVTADADQLALAKEKLQEYGLLTDKGNPSQTAIGQLAKAVLPQFFEKLKKRLTRRQGGVAGVKDTLQKLYDKKDYFGFYLYLAFMYGFVEWAVPEKVILLPAVPEVMKAFAAETLSAFTAFLKTIPAESEATAEDEASDTGV